MDGNHLIVVLGMHRSGTSVITKGLTVLGVNLGQNLLPPMDGVNEKGFFEDSDINALNQDLMVALGHEWYTSAPLSPQELTESPLIREFFLRAVDLLQSKLHDNKCFGLKDPRIARLLPFWLNVFEHMQCRVSYIIAYRNPASVARSLLKRDGMAAEKAFYLWFEHMLLSLTLTRGACRVVVGFDRVMEDPASQLKRIAENLGLPFDPDSQLFIDYRDSFLEKNLQHHQFENSGLMFEEAADSTILKLNDLLSTLAGDVESADSAAVESFLSYANSRLKDARPKLNYIKSLEGNLTRANEEMFGRDGRIAELNELIGTLNGVVSDRDSRITVLNKKMGTLDEQVASLNTMVAERDSRIAEMNECIGTLNEQVASLNTMVAVGDAKQSNMAKRIEAMEASRSWRITKPLRDLLSSFPPFCTRSSRLRQCLNPRAWIPPPPCKAKFHRINTLIVKLGDIAVRLPFVGQWADRLREHIRRRRLPKGSVVVPPSASRVVIAPYLPSQAAVQPLPREVSVAIVIPVYRGREETRRCLESVLTNRGSVPVQIVVVDDCTPDPDIRKWLDRIADRGEITLLRNETNRGFVASVNRGMLEAGGRDVVLLNSDTEVPALWLERLVSHAYSGDRIGSVTPFSNNATICSWPALPGGDLPDGVSLAAIDDACRAANRGRQVELPTAVGFCMYIRRDCLADVGMFDEAAFGRGYGEENDFCMRARAAGWRHLLACDTLVYHVGETSFGKDSPYRAAAWDVLTRRHPGYPADVAQHIEADEAAPARVAAAAALFKAAAKPVVLLVTHALGGGTERHIRDLMAAAAARINFLRLEPAQEGGRLSVPSLPQLPSIVFHPGGVPQLAALLASFGVDRVHVHHWLGLEIDLRHLLDELGVPFDVTVHDYYSLCPRINLMRSPDEGYCGEPGPAGCNACIAARFDRGLSDITEWRGRTAWLFNEAGRVLCPSEDARRRMARYVPHAPLLAVPHEPVPDQTWRVSAPVLRPGERLRIGILGVVAKHKGLDTLAAAAGIDPAGIEFVVIGFCEPPLPRRISRLVKETGPYQDADLVQRLAGSGVHAVWFPARWPETYSYTLSAALAAGLPVIAPPRGAFPERLEGRPLTWQAEPTADHAALSRLFAEVRGALEQAAGLPVDVPRNVTGDDFYAQSYAMPRIPREAACRPSVRSLKRGGLLTVLVLPDLRTDGSISPCGSIRLVQPFDVLAEAVKDLFVEQVDCRSVFHRSADILICQRHAFPTVAETDRLIGHCRRHDMRLVYDLDDDLLTIPDDHPEAAHLRALAAVVLRLVLAADRVWLATPALASRLEGSRPDAEVIPNALDERLWQKPPPRRSDEQVRIVYMGTSTHDSELAFLTPIADALHRRYGDRVRFEVVGVTARSLPAAFDRRLPDGGAANASYPGFVEWFGRQRWEIAVSPLVDGPFNRSKSAIKLMDYAARGLPIVASRHPEYEAAFGGDHGVFLVDNDETAWIEALSKLIDDSAARDRAGRLALEHCRTRHTLSRHREFREQTLRRVLAEPLGGAVRATDGRVEAAFKAGSEVRAVPLPPERLMWRAGAPDVENFLFVGDAWAQLVRRHLPPQGMVLDVGCGCGRLARFLTADSTIGGYVGFDCIKESITWCQTHILPAAANKRYEFYHVDVRSTEYNPSGSLQGEDVRFPCGTGSMDLVVAASLFAYLPASDSACYLQEIARVLKPGGMVLLTVRVTTATGVIDAGNEGFIDVDHQHFLAMARAAGLNLRSEVADFVGETLLLINAAQPAALVAASAAETETLSKARQYGSI